MGMTELDRWTSDQVFFTLSNSFKLDVNIGVLILYSFKSKVKLYKNERSDRRNCYYATTLVQTDKIIKICIFGVQKSEFVAQLVKYSYVECLGKYT